MKPNYHSHGNSVMPPFLFKLAGKVHMYCGAHMEVDISFHLYMISDPELRSSGSHSEHLCLLSHLTNMVAHLLSLRRTRKKCLPNNGIGDKKSTKIPLTFCAIHLLLDLEFVLKWGLCTLETQLKKTNLSSEIGCQMKILLVKDGSPCPLSPLSPGTPSDCMLLQSIWVHMWHHIFCAIHPL